MAGKSAFKSCVDYVGNISVLAAGLIPMLVQYWSQNVECEKHSLALDPASGARWRCGWVAVADWTKVATTESETDIYVDRASISKSGNLAKMWILEDREVADTFSRKSFLRHRTEKQPFESKNYD